MRRSLAVVIASTVALSACGGSSTDQKLNLTGVQTVKPHTLTACTDMPYEPFEFEKDGVAQGIDIDLVRAIASDLQVDVDIKPVTFDVIFDALLGGQCDLVASAVSATQERKDKYAFSDAYFEVNQSLLVKQSNQVELDTLAKFDGRKIGVQSGTTGEKYVATHAAKATATPFDSASDMLTALRAGNVDGVVQDFPINSYAAQADRSLKVVQTFTDVEREEYGFALAPGATQLRDRVDAALKNVRKDGRYDQILSKYLGSAVSQ